MFFRLRQGLLRLNCFCRLLRQFTDDLTYYNKFRNWNFKFFKKNYIFESFFLYLSKKEVSLSVNAPGRDVRISAFNSFRSSTRSGHVSRVGGENIHVSRAAAQKVASILFEMTSDAAIELFSALETHATMGRVVARGGETARTR